MQSCPLCWPVVNKGAPESGFLQYVISTPKSEHYPKLVLLKQRRLFILLDITWHLVDTFPIYADEIAELQIIHTYRILLLWK